MSCTTVLKEEKIYILVYCEKDIYFIVKKDGTMLCGAFAFDAGRCASNVEEVPLIFTKLSKRRAFDLWDSDIVPLLYNSARLVDGEVLLNVNLKSLKRDLNSRLPQGACVHLRLKGERCWKPYTKSGRGLR